MLRLRNLFSTLLLPVVAIMLMVPFDVLAQDHVATTNDLRNELRSAAQDRHDNVAKIQKFLQTETAVKTLQAAKVDPEKARAAVSLLSDQELARLASQVDRSQFAGAGLTITNQQLTYIILGVLIIVLVAVLVR
ncbi:MAG: PA2779 family protein [Acidobacteriota bacterium]